VSTNDSNSAPTGTGPQRRIALVAHDGRKQDMREWAEFNRDLLAAHRLYATGTTGRMLSDQVGLPVICFHSGPFGGDQQIGAKIADGGIDLLVFLWDPLEPQPHDHDIKALLRVAVLWNIPVACNRATADFLISSPLMNSYAVRHGPASQGCFTPGAAATGPP
jgi:methylglyoxal synthase